MRSRILALAVAGALTVTSCGTNDEQPALTNNEPANPSPADAEWMVNDLTVDGERIPLDDDWPITLKISGGVISGTAACNQYSGVIDRSDEGGHGRFIVSDVAWTEMGCDPSAMAIEQRFLAALQAVDSYEQADGMYVAQAGVGTGFHLVPLEQEPAASFTATTWVLDTYIANDTASNSPGMGDVHLSFNDNGTLIGATECHGIDGAWLRTGDTLAFTLLQRTDIPALSGCVAPAVELDSLVFGVLESLDLTASIDDQRLTLAATTGDGVRAGLSFRPTQDGDGADQQERPTPAEPGLDPSGGLDGPLMYAARVDSGDQMMAEILGILVLDGDCLSTESAGNRYPVLWP